jgi:hypothetical protein
MKVEDCPSPDGALLVRYRDMPGAYTDCFTASVAREVSVQDYIAAFYTTWLFKCERFVLMLIGKGSTDASAHALANGTSDAFAAWTVEGRAQDQLLVCDFAKLTRSWLMAGARPDGQAGTQLYFGTAVVPTARDKSGNPRPKFGFRVLTPVHRFYARALLRAAAQKVSRGARAHAS